MKVPFGYLWLAIGIGLLSVGLWQLYRELTDDPTANVVIQLPQLDIFLPGEELDFQIQIQNLTNQDLRVVGLSWC